MIGWYVHHHGRGHANRAEAVRPHLSEPVTVLSSLSVPTASRFADWIELDRDDEDPGGVDQTGLGVDPTARGRLHWAPLGSKGLARRMATVADWIVTAQPRVMVVDVSAEVAVLARLCGVPLIVMAQPGDRGDPAHTLAYDLAERIIAPWPREVYQAQYLLPYLDKPTG